MTSTAPRGLVDRRLRDADGRLVLGQVPNPAIGVWAVLTCVRLGLDADGSDEDRLAGAAAGALVAWGLDELVRGATPFRRLLGTAVLAYQLVVLVGSLR